MQALTRVPRPSLTPGALEDAAALAECLGDRAIEVAFVACSYDTAMEPVEDQVAAKVAQLQEAFGLDGPVRWSLWIVDDLPPGARFSARVEAGFERCPGLLLEQDRLRCVPLTSAKPTRAGLKGQALLDGMSGALDEGAEILVVINLNLKVRAELAATGLRAMIEGGWDACIGSRAAVDGGQVTGAGKLGRAKSIGFNRYVRGMLPELDRYKDTNAPMKIFSANAARCLIHKATIQTVTMDAEWLLLLHRNGFDVTVFPVAWAQRPGSRPPWAMIPACALDVARIRAMWSR